MDVMALRRLIMMHTTEADDGNLIHVDELTDNRVWWNGGIPYWSGICVTPKIPVTPGATYRMNRYSGHQNYCSYFDSNGTYLRQSIWDENGDEIRTMPEDVYYIGISISMDAKDTAYFGLYNQ